MDPPRRLLGDPAPLRRCVVCIAGFPAGDAQCGYCKAPIGDVCPACHWEHVCPGESLLTRLQVWTAIRLAVLGHALLDLSDRLLG